MAFLCPTPQTSTHIQVTEGLHLVAPFVSFKALPSTLSQKEYLHWRWREDCSQAGGVLADLLQQL